MFRTELPLTPHPQQLPLSARVLTIGSCFSDSIGSRLRDFKVTTMVNPFGTVFNPLSACRLLRAAAGEDMDWQQHVVEARGRWQSHDLHADIGAETPVELLQHIQTLTREVGVFLATADAVVLTLGSAFAYRLRETDAIISNCHKLPAEKFEKELLTADDIIAAVAETHAYLRRINPRLRFILTVSPVRHIKDTLVLNSTSKSMLRVACHYLSELLPDVTYFPAYELLLDDLRDYRFYAADMLHPSEVAENYIWERFTRTYFDASFGRFKKEWEGIRQALGHKPTYAAAPEHRQFLESTLERLRRLGSQADVRMETLHLERELADLPLPYSAPEPELEEEDDEERIDIGEYAEETTTSQASLLGAGAGMLRENSDEEEPEATEEQDESAPTPESAYEHAYTAGLEEDEAEEGEEEELPTSAGEEPVRRKKRRSRGGAKRTKRKHARLAAEAAQETAHQAITSEATSAVTATANDEPREAAVPATTEPQPDLPAATEAEETAPEQNEAPRRSRNNRRNQRERPARTGSRNGRPALYATEETNPEETDAETIEPTPAPSQAAPAPANVLEAAPAIQPEPEVAAPAPAPQVVEPAVATEPVAETPRAKRAATPRNRKKAVVPESGPDAAQPVAEVLPPDVPVVTQREAVSDVAQTSAAATTPVAPKARARRKPAAKAAAVSAVEPVAESAAEVLAEVVPAPLPETPVAKPPRKRPSRKTSATEPAPSPIEVPVVETPREAPAATAPAPKRKPRPPRKKPSTDTPTSENS
ncbi:GSCFA domain-containing protein [Hymenobacter sp. UYP22]|uniref:GSCFA domain-containing protein n=1 Tax=Hymenobacter sp. UYP22 TaxID=3156348 RepID=UPI0033977CB0